MTPKSEQSWKLNNVKKPCLKGKQSQEKTEAGRICANKAAGRHSVFRLLWAQNAQFRRATKNVLSGSTQLKKKESSAELANVFTLRRANSRFQPFCVDRMRGLSNWRRRICATDPYKSGSFFWHARGQAHQTKHSVRTECAIQECLQKCFKRFKAAKREAWTQRMAAWRRPV